ncbi:uncharacterized protein LOC126981810 isoform X2 [Eriocheir sinensis]|uniref:uncharacterized protein LOC126981810 isoform X2 n=1 Tax=Eriocheir sinensis TaxID=95602 RepID=UPI0021CA659F|nr:uncharacterized protein LOC126981810 isoform X2 [Eriocheir sinensis]
MNVPKHLDWTRANTLRLINHLKRNHCLWQVENKYYKHKRVRSTILNAVAKELSDSMKCVVTPDDLMKKWHTLRSQFRREVKALKESQKSGAGTEVYTPKLWCFNALTFLGGGEALQATSSNMEKQDTKDASRNKSASLEDVQSTGTPITKNTHEHMDWPRVRTLHLIDLMKQHPCLWVVRSTNHMNKNVRRASLNAVAKELSDSANCDITPNDIMKKWHTLRSQFKGEVRTMKAAQNSRVDTEVYTPRLWCYKALSFLSADAPLDSTYDLDNEETQCHIGPHKVLLLKFLRPLPRPTHMILPRRRLTHVWQTKRESRVSCLPVPHLITSVRAWTWRRLYVMNWRT